MFFVFPLAVVLFFALLGVLFNELTPQSIVFGVVVAFLLYFTLEACLLVIDTFS